ncbi:hypothetical protein E1301_Tti011658 [Triplophysa tibetana]|uniref:Uncharacterized protein n=1 Tax=Triplophysa tibetana TaxID=1572043 RepID=A0A5A9PE03_9TELE|nr:hypothetical protein E1301_Tti011658 [Triplophysa tibetana]
MLTKYPPTYTQALPNYTRLNDMYSTLILKGTESAFGVGGLGDRNGLGQAANLERATERRAYWYPERMSVEGVKVGDSKRIYPPISETYIPSVSATRGLGIPRFIRCIRARRSPPNPPCCAPAPGMGSSGFPGQAPPLLFPRSDAATSGGRDVSSRRERDRCKALPNGE